MPRSCLYLILIYSIDQHFTFQMDSVYIMLIGDIWWFKKRLFIMSFTLLLFQTDTAKNISKNKPLLLLSGQSVKKLNRWDEKPNIMEKTRDVPPFSEWSITTKFHINYSRNHWATANTVYLWMCYLSERNTVPKSKWPSFSYIFKQTVQ